MSGEEIKQVFGNAEVSNLEQQLQQIEAELRTAQEQLNQTDDLEEQETLQARVVGLREQSRAILVKMRDLKRKYPALGGTRKPPRTDA